MDRNSEVAVIGAGAAGTSAAAELLARGLKPVVLEAKPAPGGRLETVDLPYIGKVDTGGKWNHLSHLRTPLSPFEKRLPIVRDSFLTSLIYKGRMMSPEAMEMAVAEAASTFKRLCDDKRNYDGPIADLFTSDIEKAVGTYLSEAWVGEATPGTASGRDFVKDLGVPGGTVFEGGARALVGALIEAAGPENIHTRQIVREIQTRKDGVQIYTDHNNFHVAAAIFTGSVGVLQSGDISFAPVLSPASQKKVDGHGMGQLEKFYFPLGKQAPEVVSSITHLLEPRRIVLHAVPRVLTSFFGGESALTMAQDWNRAAKTVIDRLQRLKDIPHLESIERRLTGEVAYGTAWSSDPFTRGAYSFAKIGTRRGGPFETAPDSNVFIAGEWADDLYPTYVAGAIRSGQRVARMVAKRLGAGSS